METKRIDIPFFKYVSSGNDFIVLDHQEITPHLVKKMCREKWGIHSDGVLLLKKENDNLTLTIYNADGSQAKMCGNGLKIMAEYLKDKEPNQNEWDIYIGNRKFHLKKNQHGVSVLVPFPRRIKNKEQAMIYHVGNLHRLIESKWNDDVQVALAKKHPKENITFFHVIQEGVLEIKTFERGVGFTYSCGSASLAVAAHYFIQNPHVKKVKIMTRGGSYEIKKQKDYLLLKGKAKCVFIGRFIHEIS